MKASIAVASQRRIHSLLESIVNVIIGLAINIVAQSIVFPLLGMHTSMAQNVEIALIFTAISIVRSFCLRRAFNSWHVHQVTSV